MSLTSRPNQTKKRNRKMIIWAAGFIFAASVLLNITTYVFPVVKNYGDGMAPGITEQQIMILYKTEKAGRGDVIACYWGNNAMVRRVIAVEGDTVEVDIFGGVTVNDVKLEEPYVKTPAIGQTDLVYPYTVPQGCYFVMGDNREIAMDSRLSEIGPIPKDRVIGKMLCKLGNSARERHKT